MFCYATSGEVRKQSPNASGCKYCGSSFDGHVGFLIRNIYLELGFARPWNLRECRNVPPFCEGSAVLGDYCRNDSGGRSVDLDLLGQRKVGLQRASLRFMSVSQLRSYSRNSRPACRKRRTLTSEHSPCDLHRSEPAMSSDQGSVVPVIMAPACSRPSGARYELSLPDHA
jgi:hypothetical protein